MVHLEGIPAAAAAIAVGIAPLARLAWRRVRRRAVERNAHGCCAECGLQWADIGVAAREYLVDGLRVCAPCAQRLRYRTIVEYSALVATTALVSGVSFAGIIKYWRWTPWWAVGWVASTPILLAVATALVVRRMKQRNQAAIGGDSDNTGALASSSTPLRGGTPVDSSADRFRCLVPTT